VDFEPQAVAADAEPSGFTKPVASGNTEEENRESQEQYVELMK